MIKFKKKMSKKKVFKNGKKNKLLKVYFRNLVLNPHQTGVSESLIRQRGAKWPPLDIDQIMDFANSVFTGA